MRLIDLPVFATVGLDVLVWLAIHLGMSYLAWRMPAERFLSDGWLYRERRFERGGALYFRLLGIRRWKGLLPDGGGLFAGGFEKRHLRSVDPAYLGRFLLETRRAELTHYLAMAPAPLFFLWNPWPVGVFMLLYALAANLPCIAAQRYNRARLRRVLGRPRRHFGSVAA